MVRSMQKELKEWSVRKSWREANFLAKVERLNLPTMPYNAVLKRQRNF